MKVKCVAVGDSKVGKTCLFISSTCGAFPGEYVPHIFDDYSSNMMVEGNPINLVLKDVAGGEEYSKMRPLAYEMADVILLCFSLFSEESLLSIKKNWIAEIRLLCSNAETILVGTKQDLRENMEQTGKKAPFVSSKTGETVAKEIGASLYIECSALTQKNLRKVLKEAIKLVIAKRHPPKKERESGCLLF